MNFVTKCSPNKSEKGLVCNRVRMTACGADCRGHCRETGRVTEGYRLMVDRQPLVQGFRGRSFRATSKGKRAPHPRQARRASRRSPASRIVPAREACATGVRRRRLDLLVRASPSLPHFAADAGVPPVAPYPAARFVQSDLASTNGARQASLDSVFLAGFIPRLQFEVRRGGWRAAERERDSGGQVRNRSEALREAPTHE